MTKQAATDQLIQLNRKLTTLNRTNCFTETLKLFSNIHSSNILRPDNYSLSSALSAAARLFDPISGFQLHSLSLKTSLISHSHVSNTVLTLYLNLQNLPSVKSVFHDIPYPDVYSWTTLLSACTKLGEVQYAYQLLHNIPHIRSTPVWNAVITGSPQNIAFDLFKKMHGLGVGLDNYTFPSVLSLCETTTLGFGRQVHSLVIRTGFVNRPSVINALLTMYFVCERVSDASGVFEQAEMCDEITYNSMIAGLVRCGGEQEALMKFREMQEVSLRPTELTFVSVMSCCSRDRIGVQLHVQVIKTGFNMYTSVGNATITMYSSSQDIRAACSVFEGLQEKDLVTWNTMISSYAHEKMGERAMFAYMLMQNTGIGPDEFTIGSLLTSIETIENVKIIQAVVVKNGLVMKVEVTNALITAFSRHGNIKQACEIFDGISLRNLISWNTLISGLQLNGLPMQGLEKFSAMLSSGVLPNPYTLSIVLSICGDMSSLEYGKEVHGYVLRQGFSTVTSLGNSLITIYAKTGVLDWSLRVFSSMVSKDTISWNSLISAYAQHGKGKDALSCFEAMMNSCGSLPDQATFTSVLSACSHAGLVEDGLRIFYYMVNYYGFEPGGDHFSCIVDLLGRAGYLDDAERLATGENVVFDSNPWWALFSACVGYGDIRLGRIVARILLKNEENDPSVYVQLSNIYSAAGQWEEAANVREIMDRIGVAVQKAPVGCLVVGLDLVQIKPIRGAIAAQEDITTPKCRSTIKRIMEENGCRAFNLVLHDGSPNVGGNWSQEAMSQNALVIDSLKLATEFLAPKGTFVTKVFRSQDYNAVLYCLKQLFEKVEVDKPAASRSTSAEIYLVGLKYKAPAKIDPQLLDVKHLFQGGIEQRKPLDVLRLSTKHKREREGYADGEVLVRKVCSATDYVYSDTPLDVLGSVTSISFKDPACVPLKDHILTTEEVKALCEDLRVLSKQDFKHLMKWRLAIRKALSPTQKVVPPSTDVEPETKEDEEEKMLIEMEEATYAMDRKKKRAKKIAAKRLAKDKVRKALGVQMDAVLDGYGDQDLFALSSIKGKKDLVAVDAAESDDEISDIGDSENEEAQDEQEELSSDEDSENERRKYDEDIEKTLDRDYESYMEMKDGSTKQRKRLKEKHSKDELYEDGDDVMHSDQDSDNDQKDTEANPLMIPFSEEAQTQEEITRRWFEQDVFGDDADEEGNVHKTDSKDNMQVDKQHNRRLVPLLEAIKENDVQVDEPNEKIMIPTEKKKSKAQAAKASQLNDDFEIVPAPVTDSSSDESSSDESEDLDTNTKAEILAVAKKMLRKRPREDMLDDAYNKYMFHDDTGLPKWFLDEEMRHRVPMKPITKEEVNAMKAQFKEIDQRPAKKVAQAKARKQRVSMRKLEKVRKKANTISDQADITERSKRKMIETLYKKATPKRPEKQYVVAKKGVQVRTGKGKTLVDKRMKKDTRAQKVLEKKGKGNLKQGKSGKGQKGKQGGKGSAGGKNGYKGRKPQKG